MGHKTRIMYIEKKAGNLTGPARIGRMTYSKTGATVYYQGKKFPKPQGFWIQGELLRSRDWR